MTLSFYIIWEIAIFYNRSSNSCLKLWTLQLRKTNKNKKICKIERPNGFNCTAVSVFLTCQSGSHLILFAPFCVFLFVQRWLHQTHGLWKSCLLLRKQLMLKELKMIACRWLICATMFKRTGEKNWVFLQTHFRFLSSFSTVFCSSLRHEHLRQARPTASLSFLVSVVSCSRCTLTHGAQPGTPWKTGFLQLS